MSLYYYDNKEDFQKEDSINNYENIFKQYTNKNPNLYDALTEMYSSINISNLKIKSLTEDIVGKSKGIIQKNFSLIKEKYPLITKEEAQIIFIKKMNYIINIVIIIMIFI